eukprot:5372498-Ditylum_brightwellii.AAC.1
MSYPKEKPQCQLRNVPMSRYFKRRNLSPIVDARNNRNNQIHMGHRILELQGRYKISMDHPLRMLCIHRRMRERTLIQMQQIVGQGQEELEPDKSGTATDDIEHIGLRAINGGDQQLPMERWQSPTEISDVNRRISAGFPLRCYRGSPEGDSTIHC